MWQLSLKDMASKRTITMPAMSSYPRLPFRPVQLTLFLEKPSPPSPVSINCSNFLAFSSNKMSLSSLLSPPFYVLHPRPSSTKISIALSAEPPRPSQSPCPPPRQRLGHDLHGREPWPERNYVQQWLLRKLPKQMKPYTFDATKHNSGNCNTMTKRRPNYTTALKPTSTPPQSTTISKKSPPNTKKTTTQLQTEIDPEALTYYPPVLSTPRDGVKTREWKRIRVRSKIAKRTAKSNRQRPHFCNIHDGHDDKREYEKQQQRTKFNTCHFALHNGWSNIARRDDIGCEDGDVINTSPAVHDRQVKPPTRTGNTMAAMTNVTAYSKSPSSGGMAMPLKKRLGLMIKKGCDDMV